MEQAPKILMVQLVGSITLLLLIIGAVQLSDSYTIESSGITFESDVDDICAQGNQGQIEISNTIGEYGPFSYMWNNGASGTSINAEGGDYTLTVSDTRGCQVIETFTIDQAELNAGAKFKSACGDAFDGSIDVFIVGVAPPYSGYSFNWSSGATTNVVTGLAAGTYTLTITDPDGCTFEYEYELGTTTLSIDLLSYQHESGPGTQNGSLSVTGSTFNLTYEWSNGDTGPEITNLSAGVYSVTMTDSGGCSVSESYEIIDCSAGTYQAYSFNGAMVTPLSMIGASDGAIELDVTNGSQPILFEWRDENNHLIAETSDLDGLPAGEYCVKINDGCTVLDQLCYQILDCDDVNIGIEANIQSTCIGAETGSIELTNFPGSEGAGNPQYFVWDNGSQGPQITQLDNLAAGTYCVTVTFETGCMRQTVL
jgi:hypothetical protein